MIAKLKGIVHEKHPNILIINVNSIYFEVNISLNCFTHLPAIGSVVEIPVTTIFREDGAFLYGFLNEEEKKLFYMLNTVSKIGPKLALSILSTITVDKLKSAIKSKNSDLISSAPGVGKRTADRIILELNDKMEDLVSNGEGGKDFDIDGDVVSALINLGYKKNDCINALKKIDKGIKNFEEKFRETLKLLTTS